MEQNFADKSGGGVRKKNPGGYVVGGMLKLLLRANPFFLCNYYGNILKISKKTYEILEQLFILNIVCKKRERKMCYGWEWDNALCPLPL